MALKSKYQPQYKSYIITALEVMSENLDYRLKIIELVSSESDSKESHRRFNDQLDIVESEEEIEEALQDKRDRDIGRLGHVQKRLHEVKALKEAFQGDDVSPEILSKTWAALRSSLLLEAMDLAVGNPIAQIMKTGSQGLGEQKSEEVQRLGVSVQAYTQALMFGFDLSPLPMMWNEFPFDEP